MELKIKTSNWSAGLPVAMINKRVAERLGVHAGDRIIIKTYSKNPKEIITILDTSDTFVKTGFIAISTEVKKRLNLREGQRVNIAYSETPESVLFIKEKINGEELSDEKIKAIIRDVVNNSLTEPEVAVFVSAMYRNGMTFKETISLINSILASGKTLKFRNKYVVDKHCIGGVAGNRTTPLVVSICVAAGLTMPKTSSRAITSAAGTADCIETIAKVEFPMDKVKKIVQNTGGCMTWGGSLGMVPADSKIIKVEKMLKLDPIAQLLASIMSKKLAVGSKYILIDIPYGKNAKVSKSKGLFLKKKFEQLAKHFKVKMKVVLTKADEPIGDGIGPALEIIDVMKILNPAEEGPKDLEKKSLFLSGQILEMTGTAKKGKGVKLAKEILESGKAWKKFKEIIKEQEGNLDGLEMGKHRRDIHSNKSGKIKSINNKLINALARSAGCPLDKFSGVFLHCHVGKKVKKGDKLLTLYSESKPRLGEATNFYNKTNPIKI
jgi:AMP phosphorylase